MVKTRTTPAYEVGRVYCHAYLQVSPQAHHQALPETLYVGGSGCGHPVAYLADGICLFCYLQDGYLNEVPGQIHNAKTLTTNGNPQQTTRFQAYTQVTQGFQPPKRDENLRSYRRARKQYTSPAHGLFPVTSALWELMGFQPPLAIPLIHAISGEKLSKIAENLDISLYNLHERMQKGTKLALQLLRT